MDWNSRPLFIMLFLSAWAIAGDKTSPERASVTLNATAPPGAIVLFDGTTLARWASQKDRSWEETDGPADWKILEDGSLEVVPGSGSLITVDKFADFRLHLEYRQLGPPTNGGVFIMCRYELGIKHVENSDRQFGGAFENLKEPIRPLVRAVGPPLQWQAFDVEFRAPRLTDQGKTIENARATVWLNGHLIHDDVELGPRKGAAKRLGDAAAAPIMLQDHGTAYQFRNIWLIDQ